MTPTTQLPGYAYYAGVAAVEDTITDYLGDFVADYDFDGLVAAYRAAINTQLADTGISLHGNDFYSTYPPRDDSTDVIKTALVSVALGSLAEAYDLS